MKHRGKKGNLSITCYVRQYVCLYVCISLISLFIKDVNSNGTVLGLGEPKSTETDLKKSQICPILGQSEQIWMPNFKSLCHMQGTAKELKLATTAESISIKYPNYKGCHI